MRAGVQAERTALIWVPRSPADGAGSSPDHSLVAPWARRRRSIGSPARGQSQLPLPELGLFQGRRGKGWSRALEQHTGLVRSGHTRVLAKPRPGSLTCPSIQAPRRPWGRAGHWLWQWLWHCSTWPELLQPQRGEFLGPPVLQQLLRVPQAAALLPPAQGSLHRPVLFPLLVCTGLLLILPVH